MASTTRLESASRAIITALEMRPPSGALELRVNPRRLRSTKHPNPTFMLDFQILSKQPQWPLLKRPWLSQTYVPTDWTLCWCKLGGCI